jgi:DNA polymerase-3 subunit gamma/tau
MVNCTEHDLKEMNSADFRGIESIRDILRKMRLKSLLGGSCRGWIFDEVHQLTNDAQSAILKALEEPPEHVYFFLCTTDPQKLLKTIRSRCSTFEVSTLSDKQMVAFLGTVADQVPAEVLEQIAKDSQGHPREALTILEKVIGLPERQMLRAAKQSLNSEAQAIDLCRALIQGKSWKAISEIIKGLDKEEPEGVRRLVIDYASKVLLSDGNPQAYLVWSAFREPFYNTGRSGLIGACYEALEAE